MAGDKDKKLYYRCVVDCWRLFLKYRYPVEAEEYWQALNDEAARISSRYGEGKFVRALLLAFLNEIDRIWEKGR